MVTSFRLKLATAFVFAALHADRSWSSPITIFADRDSWSAAAHPAAPIKFAGIAGPGESRSFSTPAGLSIDGLTFVGRDVQYSCGLRTCTDTGTFYGLAVYGWTGPVPTGDAVPGILVGPESVTYFNGGNLTSSGLSGTLEIFLPAGTRAFGVDFAHTAGSPDPNFLIVRAQGSDGFSRPDGFVGFVSDTDILEIRITTPVTVIAEPNRVFLTNVTIAGAAPEPATFAVVGCCLAFGTCWRLKPRRTPARPDAA